MARAEILLPGSFVRRLGIALIAAAIVLPVVVLCTRTAMWRPAPTEVTGGPLRPEMVILPTGTFVMGSPSDEIDRFDNEIQHEVGIERRFAISRTEVTRGQFFWVLGERPVETGPESCKDAGVGDDLPVVCVDWLDAVRYCNELSKREGLEAAYFVDGDEMTWNEESTGYRLPTEAEWEYAARAGEQHVWVGTSDVESVCDFANVADASACDDGFEALAPVAAKLPNRWHLYGFGGNALEWVWDFYGEYPEGSVVDPSGPQRALYRVIRGGSWRAYPRYARVAYRDGSEPSYRIDTLGFRVARSLPSAP